MPHPSKAELFLHDLLLAVATDKRGLNDVITGRADGLEPSVVNGGSLCAFHHYVGAMELGSVESQHEETIPFVLFDLHHYSHVLRTRVGKARGGGKRKRSFWS